MSELGDLLKKLRGDESFRDAAKRTGISHNYLRILERGIDPRSGAPVKPSPESLKRLAKAYHYPYEELLRVSDYLPSFADKVKSGAGAAEQSATLEPDLTPYINILKEFEKELGISLSDPEAQQTLIESLRLIRQIQGLKS